MPYTDPDKQKESKRKCYEKHKEQYQAAQKERIKANPYMHRAWFRAYMREYRRKHPEYVVKIRLLKYHITPQDVERMFTEQNGKCAICGDEISLILGSKNYRHVDHHHATKKVRGLLCGPCNHAVGFSRESPAIMRQGADYLEKHPHG